MGSVGAHFIIISFHPLGGGVFNRGRPLKWRGSKIDFIIIIIFRCIRLRFSIAPY